jgi:hypothetical protein
MAYLLLVVVLFIGVFSGWVWWLLKSKNGGNVLVTSDVSV